VAFVVPTPKELLVLKKAGIVLRIYEGIVRREGIKVGPTIFQLNISASGQTYDRIGILMADINVLYILRTSTRHSHRWCFQ